MHLHTLHTHSFTQLHLINPLSRRHVVAQLGPRRRVHALPAQHDAGVHAYARPIAIAGSQPPIYRRRSQYRVVWEQHEPGLRVRGAGGPARAVWWVPAASVAAWLEFRPGQDDGVSCRRGVQPADESIISSHERSIEDFAGIDVCDEAIKSRPKKVRCVCVAALDVCLLVASGFLIGVLGQTRHDAPRSDTAETSDTETD